MAGRWTGRWTGRRTARLVTVARRVREDVARERLFLLAAGVAFWGTLSIFPMLLAMVAAYALVADPTRVAEHLAALTRPLPPPVARLLAAQLATAIRTGREGLGLHLALSLAGLLWASSRAVQALVLGLDAMSGGRGRQGFVRTRLLALLLTVAAIVVMWVMLALVAVLPVALGPLGLGGAARTAVSAGRWLVLVLLVGAGLALLYRYVPGAKGWHAVAWGAGLALPALLLVSAALSLFVSNFGRFNQVYGAVGAVAVLMLWLYLSSLVVLLGAAVNEAVGYQSF